MWETRISAVREGGMSAIVPAVLERWFTSGFRERRPADVARIAAMLAATPAAGYTLTCAAIRDMDLRAELADIRPPVLVVVGTQDVATPPRLGEAIAGSIARAKLIRLSAAHLSNIEQPEQFGAEVLAFLTAAKEEP
jgi:3-oxoadipate enol-lactonase